MESSISQTIIDTINNILGQLFSSIDNSLYSLLDKIVFVDKTIINDTAFKQLFGTSPSNGILLIVNSLLLGFILFFVINHYASIMTFKNVQSPTSFLFKLLVCAIAMNCSYFIITQIIEIFDLVSSSILYIGKRLYGIPISFSNLIEHINSNISTKAQNVFCLDGIIETTLSISLVSLMLSFSYRYVLLKVLVLLSPFAFLCLCSEQTATFTKVWFKNFFGLLFIEIFTAIILDVLFALNFNNDLSKFIYLGGIYCLIRSNTIATSFFGNIATNISSNFQLKK